MASDPSVHSIEWRSDPAQTHVVSVGISRYDIGGNFTLPRAAEHALQFAEWARFSGGVKPDNIHLFLSDGNPGAFDDRLKKARIDRRPATSQEINGFIDKQLKNYSGDLLYLFWSGQNCTRSGKPLRFSSTSRRIHSNHSCRCRAGKQASAHSSRVLSNPCHRTKGD